MYFQIWELVLLIIIFVILYFNRIGSSKKLQQVDKKEKGLSFWSSNKFKIFLNIIILIFLILFGVTKIIETADINSFNFELDQKRLDYKASGLSNCKYAAESTRNFEGLAYCKDEGFDMGNYNTDNILSECNVPQDQVREFNSKYNQAIDMCEHIYE